MKKNNWLKTYLIDIIPGVAILLYILAIVYKLAFFSAFEIEVLGYISLLETLLSIIEPLFLFTLILLLTVAELFVFSKYPALFPSLDDLKKFFSRTKKYPLAVKILIAIPLFPLYIVYAIIYLIIFSPEFLVGHLSKKRKKKKNKEDEDDDNLIFFGGRVLVFFTFSCAIWSSFLTGNSGVVNSLTGLIAPWLIISCFFIIRFAFPDHDNIIKLLKKITLREKVFFIAVYYIFAIFVFGQSGYEYGNMLKKNDSTVFTIQMNDGNVFGNTEHGYIGKMGNYIFLYERASNNKIILYNENIEYIEIRNDDSRQTLLYTAINMFKEQQIKKKIENEQKAKEEREKLQKFKEKIKKTTQKKSNNR